MFKTFKLKTQAGLIGFTSLLLFACEPVKQAPPVYRDDSVNKVEVEKDYSSSDLSTPAIKEDFPDDTVKDTVKRNYKNIEWVELMPKDDLDALLNPPSYLDDIEDDAFTSDSFEDQLTSQIENSIANANDDRYQQALVSTEVISEMDNQAIRIPGFIVPLEFNDTQSVTQFFLVPFFGACIHEPPPPPNQIIFVNYPKGFALKSLYDPFWITGVLHTSVVENDMATAAYTLKMDSFEIYKE